MIKWKQAIALLAIIIAVFGISFFSIQHVSGNINMGLDLAGGVYVLLETEDVEGDKDDAIERAKTIIRSRIDELGVAEPVVQQEGSDRVRVELAGADIDRERAMEVIGRTAQLEFYGPELYEHTDLSPQEPVEDDKQIDDLEEIELEPFVTGEHLDDAGVGYNPQGQPYVNVEFTSEGADLFHQATQDYLNDNIVIVLDNEVVSAPVIQEVIPHGEGMIDGMGSAEEAHDVALMLRSGALPVSLTEQETRTLGPSLGEEFQEQSLQAGLLGMALLVIFMIFMYRVPGLMANVALAVYLILIFNALIYLNATFTLPGLAGLVLSLGMAVDANVIIFERIKEEINQNKTLRVAVDSGFKKGIRTILDANITTLIAAAVLFYFGTGPIRGFAVTLTVGILASMITAVLFTRFIMKLLVTSKLVTNVKYFGIKRG